MDSFAKEGSDTAEGYTELEASGNAVGLPDGLMGNSEVGHLNIGAGRVVWQDVVRIDSTIKKDKLRDVQEIKNSFQQAKDGNGRLHLLGLISDGGVHSHINHLIALLKVAKEIDVPEVIVHFFGDGRDTDPKSGKGHLEHLLQEFKEIGIGKIGTIVGRYYAMDRDKRWDRVEIALKGLILGEGEDSEDPVATVAERYSKGETDEFLKPIIVGGKERRIQGKRRESRSYTRVLTECQTTTPCSFSTTAQIASARSRSSSATSIARQSLTSHIRRTFQSQP
jgi:2,3-bisphosphoglycerate-independent phosphoglycerate mutase